jgi:hypothetical protein
VWAPAITAVLGVDGSAVYLRVRISKGEEARLTDQSNPSSNPRKHFVNMSSFDHTSRYVTDFK